MLELISIISGCITIIGAIIWLIQQCRRIIYNKKGQKQISEANSNDSATRLRVMFEFEHERKSEADLEQCDRNEVDNSQQKQISEANSNDSATRLRVMFEFEHERKSKHSQEQYALDEADKTRQTNKGDNNNAKIK